MKKDMLQLKLLNILYELQPVRVTVLHSFKNIPVIDIPLYKGSQVSIPRIIAEILEFHNVVEVHDILLSQQDLAKIKFSHIQQRGTMPRTDDFLYIKTKRSIGKLVTKAKTEGDLFLLKIVEKMYEDFVDIANARIAAIFKAFQLKSVDVVERNCTLEEKMLVSYIKQLFSVWLKDYVDFRYG